VRALHRPSSRAQRSCVAAKDTCRGASARRRRLRVSPGLTRRPRAGPRFLCALHPSMRPAWAAAWARLLKPGGELVTLMFPLPAAPGAPALAAGGGADAAAGAEPAAGAAPGQERDGAPGGGAAVAAGAAGGPGAGGGGGPEQGPPWPLTRELYSELLLPSGEQVSRLVQRGACGGVCLPVKPLPLSLPCCPAALLPA